MNMWYLKILIFYCVLCAFVVTAEKDDHKEIRNQEKSHASRHGNEKSQNHGHSHVLDRHRKTETRIHGVAYRDGNQHCQVVCNNVSSSNITQIEILYNGSAGLIGFANESGHLGIIQDINNNITVILNGDSVNAVVIDNTKQKFYTIDKSAETESILWSASKSNFSDFFKKLESLKEYLKVAEEHGKSISSFQDLCKILAPEYVAIDVIPSEGNYTLYLQFISQLNTTLKFIFKGQGSFYIHKNLMWFIKLNVAFAQILSDSETKELQSADLKLNLSIIYGADSGVQAFVALFAQIGTRLDLSKVLGNGLSSPEKVLEWLEKISGGSQEGDDGIITVVITIIRTISGHGSIAQVIDVITHYNPGGSNSSIAQLIDEALDLIETQNRLFNNSAAFRGIITVLKSLNDHNCVFKSINVSDIITLLTSRNPITMIQTFIRIFSRLIGTEGFIPYIQSFLNGTDGLATIARLFPGVDPSTVVHTIQSVLSHIPFFGNIFNSSIASGFNVSNIIQSNPISGALHNLTGGGLGGGFVDGIRNASSGVVQGVENAVQGFLSGVGGFFGSGNRGTSPPPPSSSPAATNGSDAPKAQTPVSDCSNGSALTTNAPPTQHNGTEAANSESTTSTSAAPINTNTTNSTGPTTQAPILRKAHNHNLQEKKGAYHLHSDNRHGHIDYKHKVQEKSSHHGSMHELNRHENVHYRHKKHGKDFSEKNHNKPEEKKHGDHFSQHN